MMIGNTFSQHGGRVHVYCALQTPLKMDMDKN
jgi:hypothetical protein